MKAPSLRPEDFAWRCRRCDQAMVAASVTLEYLGNQFTTELPRCPACGLVHIPEELALGKMAEVEQLLEDK